MKTLKSAVRYEYQYLRNVACVGNSWDSPWRETWFTCIPAALHCIIAFLILPVLFRFLISAAGIFHFLHASHLVQLACGTRNIRSNKTGDRKNKIIRGILVLGLTIALFSCKKSKKKKPFSPFGCCPPNFCFKIEACC